jgi:hypothetical protein
MDIIVHALLRGGDAHQAQQFDHPLAGLSGGETEIVAQPIGDLRADWKDWIEGGHRLLEDHGDALATNGPHRPC